MKGKKLERSGLLAIQLLRKTKLKQGHPFMINSSTLPVDQCYLEFPDGTIQLVTLNRKKKDFEIVRDLSAEEQTSIKKCFSLAGPDAGFKHIDWFQRSGKIDKWPFLLARAYKK